MSVIKIKKKHSRFLSHVLFVFLLLCACTDIVQLQEDVVELIHNGVEAKPGKWPWHALLLIGRGICGGTFIDNNTILTAAHCVVSGESVIRKSDLLVFGGRKYRDASTKGQQEFNLAKIITHPQYNYLTYANDIAILKLTSDIKITNFVRPVNIWNTDIDENQIFGSQGTVIGFGLNEDDEESDTLQEATIPVLDTEKCLTYDNETYGSYLTTQMYCAGGKDNVSACNGDSGGGMFFNFNDTWYLRGLVSFSPTRPTEKRNLCDSSKPTVFTDVTKYRKWILRYTNTTKWLKELKPCKDGAIEIDTECNAVNRFGFLSQELRIGGDVSVMRLNLHSDPAFNNREVLALNGTAGADKDCVDGRFYWSNGWSDSIFSAKYDGMVKNTLSTEDHDMGYVAVDWISRRLYWVDRQEFSVGVTRLDNPGLQTTVMIDVEIDNIAVDPLQSKLYLKIKTRGIGQSNLDGSEPELLLEKSGIYGMTVCIATGELCYVDHNTFKIDCIDTRSRRIRTIASNVANPLELVATDELIYWLNADRNTIESVNLQGVRQKPLLNPNLGFGPILIVLTDFCPILYSPCAKNNGGCPDNTICLLNPRVQSGKICKFISKLSDQTGPSTIITSKLVKPISLSGEGKQRKWPWHAVIYSTLIKNTGYLCGGTIINMNTILTAAHCCYYNTPEGYRVLPEIGLSVSVGSDYLDGITDETQVLDVAQIVIHPQYNYSTLANDVAILKLSTDMNITNYVRPANIWNATSGQNQLVGMNGTVIGFRLDEEGEPSGKLRGTNLNVIDTKTCLEHDNETYRNRLTSQITYCADGSKDKQVCNGDVGGGMYFNMNGTWFLRGIASFSAMRPNSNPPAWDCTKPTVFTDVTKYNRWILRYTNTSKWIKTLEPCKNGTIEGDTECNAASRFEHGFLLDSQDGKLTRVPMNGAPPFNVGDGIYIDYNMDYDCVEGRLYWADPSTKSIYSAKYDGTDRQIFLSEDLNNPSYVAVDWISRRLYWNDDDDKYTLEVASLENSNLRSTLSFNAYVHRFTIDPLLGRLYINFHTQIMTQYLDGSEPHQLRIPGSEPGVWYNDIKASVATGELCYIVDGSRIECIDARSKRILTIVNQTDASELAVTNEMYYWSESPNVIESISRHGVRQQPLISNGSEWSYDSLIAVTDVCPVFYSPCAINNGDCPANTLCLLNPRAASGKICKCTQNCTPFGLKQ